MMDATASLYQTLYRKLRNLGGKKTTCLQSASSFSPEKHKILKTPFTEMSRLVSLVGLIPAIRTWFD